MRNSLLFRLWPQLQAIYNDALPAEAPATSSETPEQRCQPRRQAFRAPWVLPEPTVPDARSGPLADEDGVVEFYWVGADARVAGTLVHRWLQAFAEGKAALENAAGRATQTLRWLEALGFTEATARPIAERVDAVLRAALDDARGRWVVSGPGYAELPLSGVHDGEPVSIRIDRVRIDDDGSHWIIDYKTGSHQGGDLEGFLAAERRRYASQLNRYAALYAAWSGHEPKKALYYPMLKRFEELA